MKKAIAFLLLLFCLIILNGYCEEQYIFDSAPLQWTQLDGFAIQSHDNTVQNNWNIQSTAISETGYCHERRKNSYLPETQNKKALDKIKSFQLCECFSQVPLHPSR